MTNNENSISFEKCNKRKCFIVNRKRPDKVHFTAKTEMIPLKSNYNRLQVDYNLCKYKG